MQDSGDLVKPSRCHSVRHPGLDANFCCIRQVVELSDVKLVLQKKDNIFQQAPIPPREVRVQALSVGHISSLKTGAWRT